MRVRRERVQVREQRSKRQNDTLVTSTKPDHQVVDGEGWGEG